MNPTFSFINCVQANRTGFFSRSCFEFSKRCKTAFSADLTKVDQGRLPAFMKLPEKRPQIAYDPLAKLMTLTNRPGLPAKAVEIVEDQIRFLDQPHAQRAYDAARAKTRERGNSFVREANEAIAIECKKLQVDLSNDARSLAPQLYEAKFSLLSALSSHLDALQEMLNQLETAPDVNVQTADLKAFRDGVGPLSEAALKNKLPSDAWKSFQDALDTLSMATQRLEGANQGHRRRPVELVTALTELVHAEKSGRILYAARAGYGVQPGSWYQQRDEERAFAIAKYRSVIAEVLAAGKSV